MSTAWSFGAVVEDAGGGMVNLLVDRDTKQYPEDGAHVVVTVSAGVWLVESGFGERHLEGVFTSMEAVRKAYPEGEWTLNNDGTYLNWHAYQATAWCEVVKT